MLVFCVGVALHAGAWIETCRFSGQGKCRAVALHAGAWIETRIKNEKNISLRQSPSMRGRGLKLFPPLVVHR